MHWLREGHERRMSSALHLLASDDPDVLGLLPAIHARQRAQELGRGSFYVTCEYDHAVYATWELAQWCAEKLDREALCIHSPHRIEFKL